MTVYVAWCGRPAFYGEYAAHGYAVMQPHGPWVQVSLECLKEAEAVAGQMQWRARFEPTFGYLDANTVPRPKFSPFAALLLARAQQHVGTTCDNPDLVHHGQALEARAAAAIADDESNLPPLN